MLTELTTHIPYKPSYILSFTLNWYEANWAFITLCYVTVELKLSSHSMSAFEKKKNQN